MGKRRTGRKIAMQILYQVEVQKSSVEDVLRLYFKAHSFHPETVSWSSTLSKNTWVNVDKCDEWIKKYAIDWEFSRINPLDKSLLRLAFYELCFTETPSTVVLNEAIELAKRYSTDDSSKFINGILGSYVKDHEI